MSLSEGKFKKEMWGLLQEGKGDYLLLLFAYLFWVMQKKFMYFALEKGNLTTVYCCKWTKSAATVNTQEQSKGAFDHTQLGELIRLRAAFNLRAIRHFNSWSDATSGRATPLLLEETASLSNLPHSHQSLLRVNTPLMLNKSLISPSGTQEN